jgi:hypothetical protein
MVNQILARLIPPIKRAFYYSWFYTDRIKNGYLDIYLGLVNSYRISSLLIMDELCSIFYILLQELTFLLYVELYQKL